MTFEERAPPSYPPHTSFSDFPSCLTRFTKSTYALLKTTPSETRMHSSKKKKKIRGRGKNAELADPDLIQSLHFFESISLASVCVCVCGPSTGSVPRPRRCETRRSLRGSGALSCSVWHFGLPDAHRWRARTRAAAGGNVCSTVHSSDRLPSAATVLRSGHGDARYL